MAGGRPWLAAIWAARGVLRRPRRPPAGGRSELGFFDAFPDDAGRQARLGGQMAAALMAQAPELLAQPPVIEPVEVIAATLPG
jgi:hypothetical protein